MANFTFLFRLLTVTAGDMWCHCVLPWGNAEQQLQFCVQSGITQCCTVALCPCPNKEHNTSCQDGLQGTSSQHAFSIFSIKSLWTLLKTCSSFRYPMKMKLSYVILFSYPRHPQQKVSTHKDSQKSKSVRLQGFPPSEVAVGSASSLIQIPVHCLYFYFTVLQVIMINILPNCFLLYHLSSTTVRRYKLNLSITFNFHYDDYLYFLSYFLFLFKNSYLGTYVIMSLFTATLGSQYQHEGRTQITTALAVLTNVKNILN